MSAATDRRHARQSMVGAKRLPMHRHPDDGSKFAGCLCDTQAGFVPRVVGEYERECRTCGRLFVAVVTVAQWATEHCHRDTLHVHWQERNQP